MSAVEQSTPAVRQAMTLIAQHINASDEEIRRLTLSEKHHEDRIALLTANLTGAERQTFQQREEIRRLVGRAKEYETQVKELTKLVRQGDEELRRRAEEAEGMAAAYGEQNEELKEQADLGVRLSEEARKIVDAIERLPVKMEDASLVRATPGEIALYDTYEWQAVSDARFLILRALGEPTEEMGG